MTSPNGWTGATACALQEALRLSQETFAERLGVHPRTVAYWHQKPSARPKSEMQQILDAALSQASAEAKARFTSFIAGTDEPDQAPEGAATDAEQRLAADPNIVAALDWLDEHASWAPGTTRRAVAARLAQLDVSALWDRGSSRGLVHQRRMAEALAQYYGTCSSEHGRYTAEFGDVTADTSILTRPEWLDLDCPLIASHDRLKLVSAAPAPLVPLDEDAADRAVQRLAECLALGIRFVNMPLYRLLGVDIAKQAIGGTVGTAPFVEYAVTMDLLENELVDAVASDAGGAALPLRDRYLPNLDAVLDVGGRLTAGGTLALCAFARSASPFRGPADYVLLVQERSGHVVNASRRLAVLPKGFHQPLTDFRADAQVGATLRREMEEELFGRDDVDNTVGDQRAADPMHPSRLSDPMRWLMDNHDQLRMESTGFGLNLISGNFEFASLIVVDDESFWTRYGGQIEANWEASNLRQYSSLDTDLITELVGDVAWTNEGLFALLQGLRRLKQVGGSRVNLPTIEWEIR